MKRLLAIWRWLPLDGQGLAPPSDTDIRWLRRRASQRFWRRVPAPCRIPLKLVARMSWVAAALARSRRFSRRESLSLAESLRLLADTLASGARPVEAHIWRRFFRKREPHELPARAAANVLSSIGAAEQRQLLADKLAMGSLLAQNGLATPALLAVLRRGEVADGTWPLWGSSRRLFAKPRHGSGGRGAFAAEPTDAGAWRLDGAPEPVGKAELLARITAAAIDDDLLVQVALTSHDVLSDLGPEPPTLRLNIARWPGQPAFAYSALLSVRVPGQPAGDFLRSHVWVPIDLHDGRMTAGIWFAQPELRFRRLWWNGAALAGRSAPDFELAISTTLQAMDLVSSLALVSWDLILTPDGPVILEGNANGDWILTNLSAPAGLVATPVAPVLRAWAEQDS